MKKHVLNTLAALLLAVTLFAQSEPAAQGHSLFNIMPNYKVDPYSIVKKEFEQRKFRQADKKQSNGYVEIAKEGQLEECTFRFQGDRNNAPSNLQILANFKNAVTQKGGQLLFMDDFYKDKEFFKLKQSGDTYWIMVVCDGIGGYTISSIKEAAMKQDVVMNAAEIRTTLDTEGKVAFYGIYFDSDKAVVKPESAPTLTAIAAFLKENASINVYIVGHTDNTGDFVRNTTLSKERAVAIVNELTTKYGVAKTQLTPQGVASLAPVASNTTEEGKAKNRRVEIVRK